MFPPTMECTCEDHRDQEEEIINRFDSETRKQKLYISKYFRDSRTFAWSGRRRMKSGYQNDCILEESFEGSSDEDIEIYKSRSKIPISENMLKTKSVSRSSSGVGTSSRQSSKKKDGSDETSSRCFSPSLKTDYIEEESDSDEKEAFKKGKTEKGRKVNPFPEN